MKKIKNLKGFTLVEEVVSLVILSILILVASGMMIAAMRVYSVNVKTQSAQEKGKYVYELLDDKLTYSSGFTYSDGTNGVFSPENETYYKGGVVKKYFTDNDEYQYIKVDENGVSYGYGLGYDGIPDAADIQTYDFGEYNISVQLEEETATTSDTTTAELDMKDMALYNLISHLEVTDSAGSLTPQGEVSFLDSLSVNSQAKVELLASAGVDCTFDSSNYNYYLNSWGYPCINISNLRSEVATIKLYNLRKTDDSIELYSFPNDWGGKSNSYGNDKKNECVVEDNFITTIRNTSCKYLILWCNPEYVSFYDKDGNLLDSNGKIVGKSDYIKVTDSDGNEISSVSLEVGETKTIYLSNIDLNVAYMNGKIYCDKYKDIIDMTFTDNGTTGREVIITGKAEGNAVVSVPYQMHDRNQSSKDGVYELNVTVTSPSLKVTCNGNTYKNGSTGTEECVYGSTLEFTTNKDATIEKITDVYGNWQNKMYPFVVEENTTSFKLTSKYEGTNSYYVTFTSGTESVVVQVDVKPFPLTVTIDGVTYDSDCNINMNVNETKEIKFNTDSKDLQSICYNGLTVTSTSITSYDYSGTYSIYCSYGGTSFTITVTVTKDGDPFSITNNTYPNILVGNTYQIVHNKINNGKITDGYTITYKSNDESIATVDENGVVTGVSAGEGTITATAVHTYLDKEVTETVEFKFVVSEAIAFNKSEITVFADDEFTKAPFEILNSTNYSTNNPWGIDLSNGGLKISKDFNDGYKVSLTVTDNSNKSTATLIINIVKFKVTNTIPDELQNGKKLEVKTNYSDTSITRGNKKWSVSSGNESLLTVSDSDDDIGTRIVTASETSTGQTTFTVKYGNSDYYTYYITIVDQAQSLTIDKTSMEIWPGETLSGTLSSTLEGFNDVEVKYSSSDSGLTFDIIKNTDGTISGYTIKSGKWVDKNTAVTITLKDRRTSFDNNKTTVEDSGRAVSITVTIKSPEFPTNDIIISKGTTRTVNTSNVPDSYMSYTSQNTDNVIVSGGVLTGVEVTANPVKVTAVYTCGDVTRTWDFNVTVTEEVVTTTVPSDTSAATTVKTTTTTATTPVVTEKGESLSSYKLKLTVTVTNKSGKLMYERTGTVSVLNYNLNSKLSYKRYPDSGSLGVLTNNGDGFALKIYYLD